MNLAKEKKLATIIAKLEKLEAELNPDDDPDRLITEAKDRLEKLWVGQ